MHEIGQQNTKNLLAAGALPQTPLGDFRPPDHLNRPPSQIPGYATVQTKPHPLLRTKQKDRRTFTTTDEALIQQTSQPLTVTQAE